MVFLVDRLLGHKLWLICMIHAIAQNQHTVLATQSLVCFFIECEWTLCNEDQKSDGGLNENKSSELVGYRLTLCVRVSVCVCNGHMRMFIVN